MQWKASQAVSAQKRLMQADDLGRENQVPVVVVGGGGGEEVAVAERVRWTQVMIKADGEPRLHETQKRGPGPADQEEKVTQQNLDIVSVDSTSSSTWSTRDISTDRSVEQGKRPPGRVFARQSRDHIESDEQCLLTSKWRELSEKPSVREGYY